MTGIVSIYARHLLLNYGSFFQHYALRRCVQSLGEDCFRIKDEDGFIDSYSFLRDGLKRLASIPWHVIRWKVPIAEEVRLAAYDIRRNINFRRDYTRLIGPLNERQPEPRDYSFLAGSDQIWPGRPSTQAAFAGESRRRIAYAASADWHSFGCDEKTMADASGWLGRFDRISVREEAGLKLLEGLGVGSASALCRTVDPVFLLDKTQYSELMSQETIFSKPTLFCYLVNIATEAESPLDKCAMIADALGVKLKMLGLQGAEKYVPLSRQMNVSPVDFLRCIRDAEYIVTNSFHGIVFSIIFEKRFVFLKQPMRRGADQNERQRELLGRFAIEERGLPVDASLAAIKNAICCPIDYHRIRTRVFDGVVRSKNWLKEALKA